MNQHGLFSISDPDQEFLQLQKNDRTPGENDESSEANQKLEQAKINRNKKQKV
jgi:hypothetical protein